MAQLTFDGRELDPTRPQSVMFTLSQRVILRRLAAGPLRSVEAGQIIHAYRVPPCRRCAAGFCRWTSTDGNEAMKRLMARGLVKRVSPGVWERA